MEVRIEMSGPSPGIVTADRMKAGDYGVVIRDSTAGSIVGHHVYRHVHEGPILDLSDVPISWTRPNALTVQLLRNNESITITRTG